MLDHLNRTPRAGQRPALLLVLSAIAGCAADSEPNDPAWAPDGLEVVWHHKASALAPRAEWGPSGRDPLADFVDEDGLTPYELVLEFHSGSPRQTGADWADWDWPLHFGIGGPFVTDGTVHMFECSARGGVFDGGDYLAFCPPGTGILYLVYVADDRVPIADPPRPPEPIRQWWETTIAYTARPRPDYEFTIVPKYAYYGVSGRGYEVPVTFEPRAVLPPPPWDDPAAERWRVAKFDDR